MFNLIPAFIIAAMQGGTSVKSFLMMVVITKLIRLVIQILLIRSIGFIISLFLWFLRPFAIVALLLAAISICFWAAGAQVNTTASFPIGLYWGIDKPLTKGDYVSFCPPSTRAFEEARKRRYIDISNCPSGYSQLIKRVYAITGDVVSVTNTGVWVNGKLLPNSKPLRADSNHRPMPRYRIRNHILDSSELLLMSTFNEFSFDARYFGLIQRRQIQHVVRPVFTWCNDKRCPSFSASVRALLSGSYSVADSPQVIK